MMPRSLISGDRSLVCTTLSKLSFTMPEESCSMEELIEAGIPLILAAELDALDEGQAAPRTSGAR
jgi:hypothetical protein